MTMKFFLEEVDAERASQIASMGFSHSLEDGYTDGELAVAAADYASPQQHPADTSWASKKVLMPRRRQLVVAAALCMAEADRLMRASG